MAPPAFLLKSYSEADLPGADDALKAALEFASKVETWQPRKQFGEVMTYTMTDEANQFWAARRSVHSDLSYDTLRKTVYENHTANEVEYISLAQGFHNFYQSKDGRWDSFRTHYHFPFPLSDRDMDFWLTQKEDAAKREFVNLSLPCRFPSDYIIGQYVSVEVVHELSDGKVEWVMATTSNAAGWLPQFLQRMMLPKAIAQDVPEYKAWLLTRSK